MSTLSEVLAMTATERRTLTAETIKDWSLADLQALKADFKSYLECGRGLKKSATATLTKAGLLAPKAEKPARRGAHALGPAESARLYLNALSADELSTWLVALHGDTLNRLHQALPPAMLLQQQRQAKLDEIAALKAQLDSLERDIK